MRKEMLLCVTCQNNAGEFSQDPARNQNWAMTGIPVESLRAQVAAAVAGMCQDSQSCQQHLSVPRWLWVTGCVFMAG